MSGIIAGGEIWVHIFLKKFLDLQVIQDAKGNCLGVVKIFIVLVRGLVRLMPVFLKKSDRPGFKKTNRDHPQHKKFHSRKKTGWLKEK